MNVTGCHKCGSEDTMCLGSQEIGYSIDGNELKVLDYECHECGGTWGVTFELTPIHRSNDS